MQVMPVVGSCRGDEVDLCGTSSRLLWEQLGVNRAVELCRSCLECLSRGT